MLTLVKTINTFSQSMGTRKGVFLSRLVSLLLLFLLLSRTYSITPYQNVLISLYVAEFCVVLTISRYSWAQLSSLFAVGTSLFLFGVQPPDPKLDVLNLILLTVVLGLWISPSHTRADSGNGLLSVLFAFLLVCIASLILIPSYYITGILHSAYIFPLVDIVDGANSHSPLYSIQSTLRLFLFGSLACRVARLGRASQAFFVLAFGTLCGALLSTALGMLDYFSIIDLREKNPSRLQSTFDHPGWFAEYVTVSIPYILFGFLRTSRRTFHFLLFGLLIVCEVALILAQARAGWIAYPVTLLACWILFYLVTRTETGSFTRLVAKTLISVPITIFISVGVIVAINTLVTDRGGVVEREISSRAQKITKINERFPQWRDGFAVAMESPIIGLGFESYRWHADILQTIPNSKLSEAHEQSGEANPHPTPHNFFLSLAAGIGMIGLILWLLIILMVLVLLFADMARNRNLKNVAFIISIISFHIYCVAQSMQYIPVIWFLIFIPLGYALTISTDVFKPWEKRTFDLTRHAVIGLALVQCSMYLLNAGSEHLRERYGLEKWEPQVEGRINYTKHLGFELQEQWPDKKIRWAGRNAIYKTEKEGVLEFLTEIAHPDIDQNRPVNLDVYVNGEHRVHQTYTARGEYPIRLIGDPDSPQEAILFKTSRYFIPSKHNEQSKDDRRLAIALTDPRTVFSKGTYGIERDSKGHAYQWTRAHAWFSIALLREIDDPVIWANHPNIAENPVEVGAWVDGNPVVTLRIADHARHSLGYLVDQFADAEILELKVSRTWVPAEWSDSGDQRKLGVAISAGGVRDDLTWFTAGRLVR